MLFSGDADEAQLWHIMWFVCSVQLLKWRGEWDDWIDFDVLKNNNKQFYLQRFMCLQSQEKIVQ